MRQGAMPGAVGALRATGTRASVEERGRSSDQSLQNELKSWGNRSGMIHVRRPGSEGSSSSNCMPITLDTL